MITDASLDVDLAFDLRSAVRVNVVQVAWCQLAVDDNDEGKCGCLSIAEHRSTSGPKI